MIAPLDVVTFDERVVVICMLFSPRAGDCTPICLNHLLAFMRFLLVLLAVCFDPFSCLCQFDHCTNRIGSFCTYF